MLMLDLCNISSFDPGTCTLGADIVPRMGKSLVLVCDYLSEYRLQNHIQRACDKKRSDNH